MKTILKEKDYFETVKKRCFWWFC